LRKKQTAALKKLCIALFVSIIFCGAQLAGGILANSVAIYADTAHLAADNLGFIFSIVSLKLSLRAANDRFTFGWGKAEVLGAMLSVIFLQTTTIFLVYEAAKRAYTGEYEIEGDLMLIVAVVGLLFNVI